MVIWLVLWPTVNIFPEHVVFDPKINNQSYAFVIRNKTGEDVYSVESTLILNTFQGLRLDIAKDSRKPIVDGSEMADITAIKCRNISEQEVYIISIPHLGPQESREINFTNELQNNEITANISHFTREARYRIGDPMTMQTEFYSMRGMSCFSALMFWLDPTRPPKSVNVQMTINNR